jgi:transcriptional regulator with XRE-family HTH domain
VKEQTVIGSWLKETMTKAGMTPNELAEKSKISRASVYFYLDGSRIPSKKYLDMLCAAMNTDPATAPEFTPRPEGRRKTKV